MPSASLVKEFENLIGKENVFTSEADRQSYAYDAAVLPSVVPGLVLRPTSTEQLGALIERCYANGLPMTIRGAGTNLSGGTVPDADKSVVILTQGLNKIIEINEEALFAFVEPGVVTAQFAAAVASKGLFYPPDPGSQAVSTIGGMVVWGILGMGINAAMIIFSKGVPQFMEYMGMANAAATFTSEAMSLDKVLVALAISVTMNTIFAPVFMTFHKITDTHILMCGGSIKSLITPIPMTKIITGLNWNVQWNFVFKKTIPFFWYPAHTITFMLPPDMRVLFAALLGIVLGVLLAVAARK